MNKGSYICLAFLVLFNQSGVVLAVEPPCLATLVEVAIQAGGKYQGDEAVIPRYSSVVDLWDPEGLMGSKELAQVIGEYKNAEYEDNEFKLINTESLEKLIIKPLRQLLEKKRDERSKKFLTLIGEMERHPNELLAAIRTSIELSRSARIELHRDALSTRKGGLSESREDALGLLGMGIFLGGASVLMSMEPSIFGYGLLVPTALISGGYILDGINYLLPVRLNYRDKLQLWKHQSDPTWTNLGEKLVKALPNSEKPAIAETTVLFTPPQGKWKLGRKEAPVEMVLLKRNSGEDTCLVVPRSELHQRFRRTFNVYRVPNQFLTLLLKADGKYNPEESDSLPPPNSKYEYQRILVKSEIAEEGTPEKMFLQRLRKIRSQL